MPAPATNDLVPASVAIPIDAIGDSVCVLDHTFAIIAVNAAWRRFADENPPIPLGYGIGTNYRSLCEAVAGVEAGEAHAFLRGLHAVLQGAELHFTMEYCCHAPAMKRWFRAGVVRFGSNAGYRLLVTHTDITREYRTSMLRTLERDRSKEAARASDMKYRALFRSMKEGVFYQNADGSLADVNEAALSMLGLTREQFLSRTSLFPGWDIITEDGRSVRPEEHPSMLALRNGAPIEGVTLGVWNPKDRAYRWFSVTAIPILREGEAIPGQVFVTFHDLTRWKEREEKLRYQAMLLDQISDTILATDLEEHITYVNRAMTEVLGRSAEELKSGTPELLGDDPLRGATQREITEATKRDGEWCGEVLNRTSDGREIMQLVRTIMVRDEAGRPIGMCGVGTDITERKRAEERLAQQEAIYRAVVETTADGFIITGQDGLIRDVNPAYCRLSGYTRDELVGSPIALVEVTESREEILAHIRRVTEVGTDLFETRHRKKDGTVWLVQVSVAFWPIGGGTVFGFFRDVVGRHKSEALLFARMRYAELSSRATIQEMMQVALDDAELFTGSSIGFFHFVDEDQQSLTLQAWSTNTRMAMCRAEGQGLHYPIDQAGVWTDCYHARRPVIHNDLASLPHLKGMPDGHAPVVRELVVPVIREGKVIAVFGVGNKTSDYTENDVEAVDAISSMVMDIVQRERAEARRRISEERFRLMFELSGEGILHSDPRTGAIFAANRAACTMLGLSEAEICRGGRSSVLDPQDPRGAAAVATRAASGHVETDLRMVRGDGSTFEANISSAIYNLSDGSVRTDVVFRDVSQRRQMELALRKLSAAVDFSPLAVVITDRAGVIEYVNPRFEQATGYTRDEVLGMNPRILQSGLTPRQVYADLWDAVGRGAMWHGEFQNRKKDGTLFWEEAWIAPIPDPSGGAGHIVGMKEDISARKMVERRLGEQHEALAAFASHLEAARETERTMIAREVHDAFGQILSAVKLDAMMLAGSDVFDPDQVSRKALSIVELVETGLRTVHEIAARLRPGILDNLGLIAALEWQAEDFQTRTGIRCQTTFPDTDVAIDPETATTIFRCAQALMTNVLLHARARSVMLVFEDDREGLTLTVDDDGVGIDPACLHDPRSYGLIGIRERARALGGTFTIERGGRGGTVARVMIPRRKKEERE